MLNESTLTATDITGSTEIHFPNKSQTRLAWEDIRDGFIQWRVWTMLAYQDIKLRYRRSVLGPFWLTLSMAITVYSMGYLYSYLFHMNIREYFPYLVAGMLGWSLVSTTLTDLIDAFSYPEAMLKQIKLPYSIYIHRVAARNTIIFFHNILIMGPILILFHDIAKINLCFLLLFPGLLIIYFNSLCYGLVFSMIGARYRDISQIIKSLIQVAFYITPIMWTPEILPPSKRFIAYLNPFYSFIELVRQPLIGHTPTLLNIIVVTLMTLIAIVAAYVLFPERRSRIIYWL